MFMAEPIGKACGFWGSKCTRLIRFDATSFGYFLLIFGSETLIALYVRDRFIRPFLGDVLVVLLICFFFMSFLALAPRTLALATLMLAFGVEAAQYFDFLSLVGLGDYRLARVILGSTFDWLDLVAYAAGFGVLVITGRWFKSADVVPREPWPDSSRAASRRSD